MGRRLVSLLLTILVGCKRGGPAESPADKGSTAEPVMLVEQEQETVPLGERPTTQATEDDLAHCNESSEISHGQVETVAEGQELMRAARFLPVIEDGATARQRISGLRSGSLLDVVGLKNGDEVQAINGYPLQSPEQALEAYAALRKNTSFRLEVYRSGQPWSLCVRVVEP